MREIRWIGWLEHGTFSPNELAPRLFIPSSVPLRQGFSHTRGHVDSDGVVYRNADTGVWLILEE